jgi:hypothetical protein
MKIANKFVLTDNLQKYYAARILIWRSFPLEAKRAIIQQWTKYPELDPTGTVLPYYESVGKGNPYLNIKGGN